MTTGRAAAVLWPLLLLNAFVGTFRRTAGQPVRRDVAHACDRAGDSTPEASDIAILEGCLAVDPTSLELILPLALAYDADGSSDKAEAMYRRAIATDPRDGDLHVRLGEILC